MYTEYRINWDSLLQWWGLKMFKKIISNISRITKLTGAGMNVDLPLQSFILL